MKLFYGVTFLACLYCLIQDGTVLSAPQTKVPSQCSRVLDVAIVGAGPAGAYSAYKLRHANQVVELFEYSNRIGGRLFTLPMPSNPYAFVELGAAKYNRAKHRRVDRLVEELNLNKHNLDIFEKPETIKYFIRGKRLTLGEVIQGDVPYDLSPEEKANQARLTNYYLEKLTGFNETLLTKEQLLKLRVADGRPLYKLTFNEALDLVATAEGKEYIKSVCGHDSYFSEDASATDYFHAVLGDDVSGNFTLLKDGMSKLPQAMVEAFLASSTKHQLSLNRKLEDIQTTEDDLYQLELWWTVTSDHVTKKTKTVERVCAKKVILAIPQRALIELDWDPMGSDKVMDALTAVNPVNAGTVILSFQEAWWLNGGNNSTSFLKSDTPISVMHDLHSEAGEFLLVGSFADFYKAEFLENINSQGRPIPGSASGAIKVTYPLMEEILTHLADALGKDRKEIPEPVSSFSKFWSNYPYGGGWSVWKAGFQYDEVRETIQHPSLTDDVYVVGSDYAFAQSNIWVESALASVDEVFEKFAL